MQIMAAGSSKSKLARGAVLFALIVSMLPLTACHKGAGGQAKSGQTIARVNGDDITIGQLNYELQRANIKADQQDAVAKQMMQGLIDRQLVTQAALDAKLDRNPRVLQVRCRVAVARARSLQSSHADRGTSRQSRQQRNRRSRSSEVHKTATRL